MATDIKIDFTGLVSHTSLMTQSPLEARFWSNVNKDGPVPAHCPELGKCWNWTGRRNEFGYGITWQRPRETRAHRLSWVIHFGVIPDGLCVLHKCDNPACIRPDHLFTGTKLDNLRDAVAKGRPISQRRGELNSGSKLTEAQVLEIRRKYRKGVHGFGATTLCKEFGVSPRAINQIVRRLMWDHI